MRIVMFGDSICVGQGVSVHRTWVSRLSAELQVALGDDAVIVNASVNGNTTRMALERMPYDVQTGGMDYMYTQFGLNDCNHWITDKAVSRLSIGAYEANLLEIIERGRIFGARQVSIGTNHGTTRFAKAHDGAPITYEDNRRRFNDVVRNIAAKDNDLVLIDHAAFVEQAIADGRCTLEETLLADGLHLSVLGHDLYLEHAKAKLMPHILKTLA